MGAITDRHRLGVTVDTTNPQAMADALVYLSKCAPAEIMDPQAASEFAEYNSTSQLAKDLLKLVS